MIDVDTMVHKDTKEIDSEWLCYNTWQKLKIDDVLKSKGWNKQEIQLAQTQIISRAVYPSSELATARRIKENSAICDLTGFDEGKINHPDPRVRGIVPSWLNSKISFSTQASRYYL